MLLKEIDKYENGEFAPVHAPNQWGKMIMVEDNPVYNRKLLKIFTHKIKRPERMLKFKNYMLKKQDDSDWEDIDK